MKFLRHALSASALLVVATLASAQPAPIKPGLWQMRMEQDNPEMAARMREAETQMKNMPPEARKQMEAMMKQHGVNISTPGEIKMCLSQEQLSQEGWQGRRDDSSGCKNDTTRSGNTWKFHTVCPAPHKSQTDGEATFVSPERYTVKSTTTTGEGAEAKTMKMSVVSTWLGADCGDIKPIQPPKKK